MSKKLYIISYNFGSVKAGPVIRFIRYSSLLYNKNVEVVFLTKKRATDEIEIDEMESKSYKTIYFDCDSSNQLTQKALTYCNTFSGINIILLSIEYKCFREYKKTRLNGNNLIYVSTMRLNYHRKNIIRKLLLKYIWKATFNQMSYIINSTSELNEEFVKLGIAEKKLLIIPNGVDTDRFKPVSTESKQQLRHEFGIDFDKKVILYVGLFIDRKGILNLYDTWKELISQNGDEYILCLVGQFKDTIENSKNFNTQWVEIKREWESSNNVMMFPFSDTVEKFFQLSDAFIFYSYFEGMPNVYLEAMASGLVIFTSNFEGFSSVYGRDKFDYLLLSRNPKDDKQLIDDSFKSDQVKLISQNSYKKAISEFSIHTSINKYYQLLIG